MEINEKKKKKEQQELIIRKYQQYLKLEKSLSPNTLEAYLTDLDKLMSFLTLEGINVLEVCLSDLQRFTAGLHDIGIHPRSQFCTLSENNSFLHGKISVFCIFLAKNGVFNTNRTPRAADGSPTLRAMHSIHKCVAKDAPHLLAVLRNEPRYS